MTGKKIQLSRRYYLFALCAFLIYFIVNLLLFFFGIRAQIHDMAKQSALADTARQSERIQAVMERQFASLQTVADFIGADGDMEGEEDLQLLDILKSQTGLLDTAVIDTDGILHDDSGAAMDLSQQEFFRKVMEGEPAASGPLGGDTPADARVILAVPIRNGDSVTGALAGIYDVAGMSGLLFSGEQDLSERGSYMLLATLQGEVVAGSFREEEIKYFSREGVFSYYKENAGQEAADQLRQEAAKKNTGIISVNWDGKSYFLIYGSVPELDWLICQAVSVTYIEGRYGFIETAEMRLFGTVLLGVGVLLLAIRILNHRKEEKLLEVAQTDALTGLLNKKSTEEKINLWLQSADEGIPQAFLMIDIDRFKEINDVYGHVLGDEVLRRIGSLLKNFFREGDLIGRIGGDEFVVLMKNIPTARHACERAGQLSEEMKKIRIKGMEQVQLTGSMGMAVSPEHGKTYLDLYRCADEALYTIKRDGRDGCAMY